MSNDNITNVNSNDDTEGHFGRYSGVRPAEGTEDTEGHVVKVRPFLPDAEVADDTEGNCFKYGTDVPDTGSVRQTNNSEPAAEGDDTEGHSLRYSG